MAVKMRLRREGKKKQPFYRVVVADVRSPRDGGFIEDLGYYQPLRDPSVVKIDHDRALHWLRNGVQPSDAVRNLLRITGIWEEFKPGDPGRERPAKRAAEEAARARAAGQPTDADRPKAGDSRDERPTGEVADPRDEAPAEVVAQAREEDAQPPRPPAAPPAAPSASEGEPSGEGAASDESGAVSEGAESDETGAASDETGAVGEGAVGEGSET